MPRKLLLIGLIIAFCFGKSPDCRASRSNGNYLVPVKEALGLSAAYKELWQQKLLVTPGEIARFVGLPGTTGLETTISVYRAPGKEGSLPGDYWITATQASERLWNCVAPDAQGQVAQNQLAGRDGTKPRSLRQLDYLSPSKQKCLTKSANAGDSAAALVLADHYALVDKKPGAREHFLQLAVRSGSKTAYDALIAFYVQPGGILRSHEALALRRDRFRRYASASNIDDKTWAYQSSLKFKHSTDANDAPRRRELLRIAAALGSRKAAQEIAESAQERVSRVSVSESN